MRQLGKGAGDALHVPSRLAGGSRKAESGDRRTHHMERVAGCTAVMSRIGKRANDIHEFNYRAWPPVGYDQRQRVGFRRSDVQEVQLLPVDGGGALGEL